MPWNDHANPGPSGNGPWGGPPHGEAGQRPEGGGRPEAGPANQDEPRQRPPPPPPPPGGPDFSDLRRRIAETADRILRRPGGHGLRPPVLAAVAAVGAFAWTLTGVYTVQANQEAVVTRFGGYARSVGPGLHYHLPTPIERAELVSVTNQNKTVVGGSTAAPETDESLMLTGDENIVDLSFAVQWHVADAAAYLFKLRDPDDAVKAVAESAMREVVGRSALKSILTTGRGDVERQTLALMQRILDSYQSGIVIDQVQIQNANPPADVVSAYQDIAKAGQDAQSSINGATAYRNQVVNEARGTAAKIVKDAQGYREQVVREAQGEASRFNQVYVQYRLAPAVTRERLYIQSMQQVLAHTRKVIIDAKGATAPIILPPEAFRPANPGAAAAPPQPQPQPGGAL